MDLNEAAAHYRSARLRLEAAEYREAGAHTALRNAEVEARDASGALRAAEKVLGDAAHQQGLDAMDVETEAD